jgi:hypothetical protein
LVIRALAILGILMVTGTPATLAHGGEQFADP